ncbi:MAG: flavodoxin family protein [Pseudomonadota bacterium]
MKSLLIVAHAPSPNTAALRDAVVRGAEQALEDEPSSAVEIRVQTPFSTDATDVKAAAAILLGTPENLGYMSGALKDFFDRIYEPCLEETRGLPYACYVRAGHDGTGTRRAVEAITAGLGWRSVSAPLICKGPFDRSFVDACAELGGGMAAGLAAGIF